ncbi:MAG: TonB family protein [Gemmatimonadales bacterium]|jgi:TonB family protein
MNTQQLPQHEDANVVFERHWTEWVALGVTLSVALHFGVFMLFPRFHTAALATGREGITAIQLPPEVHVPPPPELIARPATPRVGTADMSEEITIAPTTFEANPVENLAPPPAPVSAPAHTEEDRPRFIPYDTPPRLLNPAEIRKLLNQRYPSALREARVEGRLVLWIYIDREGEVQSVQVQQSSGYEDMDRVAVDVGYEMRFSAAKNRDKTTPVWVQQGIAFDITD